MSGILYDFDFQYFVSQQSMSVKVFDWLILFHEIWLLTKSRLVYNNLGRVFIVFYNDFYQLCQLRFENMATDCNHYNDG